MRGEGRRAGQHESAAAGAETAQSAGGPGGGDGAPSVPRPHQCGGPAGKPRGGPVMGAPEPWRGAWWGGGGSQVPQPPHVRWEAGPTALRVVSFP